MTATTLALPSRYRGTELIASGGMADVYRAHDDALERLVAIKALNDRFAGDPEIRQRFTREARIAARLSTEANIVTIYDVADAEGRPTIVMEYLPGGTLADRLQAGPIAPALALAWLEQAARALDAAHAAGVIHRDVKPANLMLGADGDIRVTDFGIARVVGDVALTSVGTILGTSGYMSPEQAVGGQATAASDRYGLGVVAFELLSGRRPYQAETFAAEAAAHAAAPIPAATGFNKDLPVTVDAILQQSLAKAPDARPHSCGEMVARLRAAFSESAGTTRRVSSVPPLQVPSPAAATTMRTAAPAPGEIRARKAPGTRFVLAVLTAIGLAGIALAFVLSRGDEVPTTTIVETRIVAGEPEVQTVTIETQVITTAPATVPPASAPPATDPSSQSGAALNEQGFALLQSGNAEEALPFLEQAVTALRGSSSLDEAYASYNLALARFSNGDCQDVEELLDRSEQIQGKRAEINRLRKDLRKGCDD